jgi:hypothetical protein
MAGPSDYGKGDRIRPFNRKAWDEGYLRAFGQKCPDCRGHGTVGVADENGCMISEICGACKGSGKKR